MFFDIIELYNETKIQKNICLKFKKRGSGTEKEDMRKYIII
jgi:hypothetical protein